MGKDGRNVQAPPAKPLSGTWWWRADALDNAGRLLARGEVWQFTVGAGGPPSPSPGPPSPSPAPADQCQAAEDKYCRGKQGKGRSCNNCVKRNSAKFKQAGCYSSSKHDFVQGFCHAKEMEILYA